MKTKYILSTAVICTAILTSCHNDDTFHESGSILTLTPTLEVPDTRSAVLDGFTPKKVWEEGDKMGLFLYQRSGWGEPYLHFVSQNQGATFQGNEWKQDNPIYLNTEKATVWTYYPYAADVTDGTCIPVPIHEDLHIDYMWGKSVNDVWAMETEANVPMNHALSQFVLRLKIAPEYEKKGELTKIRLFASEPTFALEGTMDLSQNGKISFEPTLKELSWIPASHAAKSDIDFAATVYPMILTEGKVTLEIVLDGETWQFRLPAVEWKSGKRHIYTVSAKFKDLVLDKKDGNAVSVKPWIDTNIDVEIEGK